jgi:hypothetical protein
VAVYGFRNVPRYVVYDPADPRKGKVMLDATLGQIILAEGDTITKALSAASPPPGAVVWDRKEARIAYVVPASG